MITRRDFIKYSLRGVAAVSAAGAAIEIINPLKLFCLKGWQESPLGFSC